MPQPGSDIPKSSLAEHAGDDAGSVLGFDGGVLGCIGNVTGSAGDELALGVGVTFAGPHVTLALGPPELPQGPGLPGDVLGWLLPGWDAGVDWLPAG